MGYLFQIPGYIYKEYRPVKKFPILLLLLVACFSAGLVLPALGQDLQQEIPSSGPDLQLLEHAIKSGVDRVRTAHNLTCLYNDSILFVAAAHHAGYLKKKKRLSHTEREFPAKVSPQLRADYFGAINYFVGENVAFTYFGQDVKDKKGKVKSGRTYEEVANLIVTGWVNSPGHYQNIITPDYQITGLAISVDLTTRRVYAVQKFARVAFQFEFTEDTQLFPYSDANYPQPEPVVVAPPKRKRKAKYWLKPYAPEPCATCEASSNFLQGLSKLEYKGSRVYLVIENADMMRAMLKDRNDGLLLETVDYEPSVCANPNFTSSDTDRQKRIQKQGKPHKVFWEKDLRKGYKRGKRIKFKDKLANIKVEKNQNLWWKMVYLLQKRYEGGYFKLRIGDLKDGTGFYAEPNVLIIDNGQVCNVWRYTNYEGKDYFPADSFEYLPIELRTSKLNPQRAHYLYQHYFKPNQTNISTPELDAILDTLNQENCVADSIFIKARSSVEGNARANEKLQLQRANSILDYFQSLQQLQISKEVVTQNSWKMFREQLQRDTNLRHYADWSNTALSAQLRDNAFIDSVYSYLSQQRYALVHIYAIEDTTASGLQTFLEDRLDFFLKEIEKIPPNASAIQPYLDSALYVQQRLFPIKPASFASKFHNAPPDLQFKLALFLLQDWHLKERSYDDFNAFQQLASLLILDKTSLNLASFHQWVDHEERINFFTAYSKMPLEKTAATVSFELMHRLLRMEQRAAPEEYQVYLTRLRLRFNFLKATRSRNDPLEHAAALMGIFNYYADRPNLPDTTAIAVCKYFILHEESGLGYSLLDRWLQTQHSDSVLVLHTQLGYHYNGFQPKETYIDYLIGLRDKLPNDAWCGVFLGKYNLSFQLFDSPRLRSIFCEQCAEREAWFLERLMQQPEANSR